LSVASAEASRALIGEPPLRHAGRMARRREGADREALNLCGPRSKLRVPASTPLEKKTAADASTAVPFMTCMSGRSERHLDDVDLSRQVARDLEANFLLANLRLVPDLHDFLRWLSLVGELTAP